MIFINIAVDIVLMTCSAFPEFLLTLLPKVYSYCSYQRVSFQRPENPRAILIHFVKANWFSFQFTLTFMPAKAHILGSSTELSPYFCRAAKSVCYHNSNVYFCFHQPLNLVQIVFLMRFVFVQYHSSFSLKLCFRTRIALYWTYHKI